MKRSVLVLGMLGLVVGCKGGEGSMGSSSFQDTGDSAHIIPTPPPERTVSQEDLAQKSGAVKVSGTLEVPGYEKGSLQIDVFTPGPNIQGRVPLTVARFPKPGPFEFLVPPGTTRIELKGNLDFDSDGPNTSDATTWFTGNPIDLRKQSTGILFRINKTDVPKPPPEQRNLDAAPSKPPWELVDPSSLTQGTGSGAPPGSSLAGMAPQGKPAPAPPGAPGGGAAGQADPAPQGKPVPAPPGAPGGGTGQPK